MSDGPAPKAAKPLPLRGRARDAGQSDRAQGPRGEFADDSVSAPEMAARLKTFLDLVLRETALAVRYEISAESEPVSEGEEADYGGNEAPRLNQKRTPETGLLVRWSGEEEGILLARNGELLLALEYLAHRWLRLPPALYDRVRLECGDFRATRLEELKLSARVAAQRVRETGQPFPFNPMSSRDRRTIHLELSGAPGVRTVSEGSGDRRHLVIYPASKK